MELCLMRCNRDVVCEKTCRMKATTSAKSLVKTLHECRRAICYAPDAGAAPCVTGAPESSLCMRCLSDADSAPGACTDGGSPSWCGPCYRDLVACDRDLP